MVDAVLKPILLFCILEAIRELQFYGSNGYPPSLYNSYSHAIGSFSFWPPYGGMRPYGAGYQRGVMNQNTPGRGGLRGEYSKPGMSGWGAAANYYADGAGSRYLALRNQWQKEIEPALAREAQSMYAEKAASS